MRQKNAFLNTAQKEEKNLKGKQGVAYKDLKEVRE